MRLPPYRSRPTGTRTGHVISSAPVGARGKRTDCRVADRRAQRSDGQAVVSGAPSTSWVYEAVRTGRLPCHRVGRHIRFTRPCSTNGSPSSHSDRSEDLRFVEAVHDGNRKVAKGAKRQNVAGNPPVLGFHACPGLPAFSRRDVRHVCARSRADARAKNRSCSLASPARGIGSCADAYIHSSGIECDRSAPTRESPQADMTCTQSQFCLPPQPARRKRPPEINSRLAYGTEPDETHDGPRQPARR